MRNLALACAALAIVAGIVSVNLWRDLRDERQTTAQLRAQLTQQPPAAVAANVPAPVPSVAPSAAVAPVTAQQAAEPTSSRAPAEATARDLINNLRIDQRELLKDPEYRKAALAQARLNVPRNYPDLFEVLGLAPEQAERLTDLLAEQQLEQNSVTSVIGPNGIDQAAMAEVTRRAEELQRRRDEEITALLGPAGLQEFKAYEQTRAPRMQAQNMRQLLDSAGLPLAPAQVRAFTEAHIAVQRNQSNATQDMLQRAAQIAPGPDREARMREAMLEVQEDRNRRLLDAVRPHLNAQQIARLEQNFEQQLAMTRAQTRVFSDRLRQQGGTQAQGAPALAGGGAPIAQP